MGSSFSESRNSRHRRLYSHSPPAGAALPPRPRVPAPAAAAPPAPPPASPCPLLLLLCGRPPPIVNVRAAPAHCGRGGSGKRVLPPSSDSSALAKTKLNANKSRARARPEWLAPSPCVSACVLPPLPLEAVHWTVSSHKTRTRGWQRPTPAGRGQRLPKARAPGLLMCTAHIHAISKSNNSND